MGHNASDRKFIRTVIRMDGQSVGRHILKCSEPGCGEEHEIIDRGHRQLPFDEVRRRFERDKWFVGKNEKHDQCPKCVKKHRDERSARLKKFEKPAEPQISNVVPITQGEPVMTTTMPDRPISREDKKIINLKLHEVYMGDDQGYYPPHTDHSVAKELGIPVKWVADIREEMFGPAHSNSDIEDQLAKIEAVKAEVIAVAAETQKALVEIRELTVKLPPLTAKMNELQRTIEALTRTSEVIRKAVS